jgi:hypothetical protein
MSSHPSLSASKNAQPAPLSQGHFLAGFPGIVLEPDSGRLGDVREHDLRVRPSASIRHGRIRNALVI